jgi:hypothetical protein
MSEPFFCWRCGAKNTPVDENQGELPLGPFSLTKKLDEKPGNPPIIVHHHNNDEIKNNHHDEEIASPTNLRDALRHPYWKKFARYCEACSGSPTLRGFCTWLAHRAPPRPARQIKVSAPLPTSPVISGEETAKNLREWRERARRTA